MMSMLPVDRPATTKNSPLRIARSASWTPVVVRVRSNVSSSLSPCARSFMALSGAGPKHVVPMLNDRLFVRHAHFAVTTSCKLRRFRLYRASRCIPVNRRLSAQAPLKRGESALGLEGIGAATIPFDLSPVFHAGSPGSLSAGPPIRRGADLVLYISSVAPEQGSPRDTLGCRWEPSIPCDKAHSPNIRV